MKQDDIDTMMSEIDRKCKLPKHWEEFIEKDSKNHNLIIKNPKTKELYCTNCKNHFVDKLAKVRDHVICPHCNKKYWYKYNGYRFFTNNPTYPYNKKRLVKGTNMEYAPINEFLDRFSYYRYNYLDVLELAAYPSFELLWNMSL